MKTTKNIPLLVGISLPIIFIIIITIVIFVPSWFVNPQNNFLYSNVDQYYSYQIYSNTYVVKDGHLSLSPVSVSPGTVTKGDYPPLYIYDVKSNTAHQIDYNEAKNYYLDPGLSSPDGYTVQYENNNSGIFELFGSSGARSGYVITKGSGSKRLNGLNTNTYYYYSNNFKFIGWIK